MDCITGAAEDQQKGVEMGTHAKYTSSWCNWLVWLEHIGADDPYLQSLTQPQRIRILCAFLYALRRGDFNPTGDSIKGETAEKTINHVAATIVSSGGEDPRLDKSGNKSLLLSRQLQSYKKVDPKTKHQKAIPPEVYRFILRRAVTPRAKALAELLCFALFFACRSCEYTKTQRADEKQTRPIRPCDIEFRLNGKRIPHDHPQLHKADYVIVTFGPQKVDLHRDEAIPQQATDDAELNPVWHAATTIRRLMSYPDYDPTWPIHIYYDTNKERFSDIRSYEVLDTIKAAVTTIGYDILGFTADDVGTHSNRGAFAMMLYLAGESTFTIMKLGRWASDAFLDYIEQQILTFSNGVSKKMLFSNTFFNFPVNPTNKRSTNNNSHSISHHSKSARQHIYGRHNSLRDLLRHSY